MVNINYQLLNNACIFLPYVNPINQLFVNKPLNHSVKSLFVPCTEMMEDFLVEFEPIGYNNNITSSVFLTLIIQLNHKFL